MVTKEQMIERMARAICERVNGDPDRMELATGDGCDPRSTYVPAWEGFVEEAEAALDASGLWPVYEAAQIWTTDDLDVQAGICAGSDGKPILEFRIEQASEDLRAALTAMEQTNG